MFAIGLFIYALVYLYTHNLQPDEEGDVYVHPLIYIAGLIGGCLMLFSIVKLAWKYLP